MAMIRIKHSELGESRVNDESLPVWESKGWSKVEEEPQAVSEAPRHAAPDLSKDESAQTSDSSAV